MTVSLTCGVQLLYKTEKKYLEQILRNKAYDNLGPNWGKNDYARFF